ncbi:TPA: YadA-like family protein [Pasteurella multocida]|uniref:YadA family autotransporter adhesin n=1 Tax=Pasteurella multocida TaxID=747 RepID=UPI0007EDF30C|nr:YadA-like family protein [Pasteurella multocida]MCO5920761.1 YadA-like family protein [Pasteurella multocida]HDR1306262.1 YadA-like family protein [Pasteurella multocida]
MNKIYRTLWNAATQSWVVVSELAKAGGKSASGKSALVNSVSGFSFTLIAASVVLGSGQVNAAEVTGNTGVSGDDKYCFYNAPSQSVICGDATTKTTDKTDNKPAKSVVIGFGATNDGETNVAISSRAGQNVEGHDNFAALIEAGQNIKGSDNIAIGKHAGRSADPNTKLNINNTISLGKESVSLKNFGIAQGHKAKTDGVASIAIGLNAQAVGGETANIAIGENAKADASGAIVLGKDAEARSLKVGDKKLGAYSAIVIGTSAKAIAQEGKNENPKDAIAIGTQAEAHYASTIALGFGAKSDTKAQAVSIGYNSNAKGYQAIAFGSEAKTTDNAGSSIAFGTKAQTRASASIAIGMGAETGFDGGNALDGADAVAIGKEAKAKKQNALALGNGAIANDKDAVALGAGAETAAAEGTNEATVNTFKYSGFAGTAPIATVSVGKADAERTITNVAAGRINATSTDAINGSQLYLALNTLGYVGDTLVTNVLGGDAAIVKEGDKAAKTEVVEGDNIVVTSTDGANGNKIYKVATAKEVTFDKTTVGSVVTDKTTNDIKGLSNTALGGDNFAKNGRAASEEQLNATQTNLATLLGGNAQNTNGNVAMTDIGGTGKNNINDAIKASRNEVKQGKNMVVTPTTGANGQTIYEVATADKVAFDEVKVGGITIDGTTNKISGIAKGEVSETSTDAVNGSQLHELSKQIMNQSGQGYNILNNRINKVDKDLRAGIAGANAAAGLPQAYIPGKSMVAVAAGTYKGQNAIALGMSRISDNGKVIIKLTGNTNSRGDFGASIGAGYQW